MSLTTSGHMGLQMPECLKQLGALLELIQSVKLFASRPLKLESCEF